MAYSEADLAHLLRDVRRPYQSGGNRDQLYDNRRAIRKRTARPWLPADIEIKNESIYFRDPLPAFVINRIKQRLGANAIDITIKVAGDAGQKLKDAGNTLEDWDRGAWDYLDPMGLHDGAVREHQSTDGVGFYALDCLPQFLPPTKGELTDEEYDDLVSNRRKGWPLPMRLSSPDPRSLYWIDPPNGRTPLMCEVINVPLASCKDSWTDEGFRLAWQADGSAKGGKVVKEPLIAGQLTPAPTAAEYGRMVRVVKISDDSQVYHCIYNVTAESGNVGDNPFSDDKDGVPGMTLLATYRNHLGRVPYFMAPARRTTDSDPAFRYEPLAMEVLDMGEYINQLGTLQMVLAHLEVMKPIGFKPDMPPAQGEAAVQHIPNLYKPGILRAWGQFMEVPSPKTEMFEKAIEAMTERQSQFNLSLMGMLQGGQLGKGTPAWSLMQLNEEQVGFISDALTSRAMAIREVLEAVNYLCRTRYAVDAPVYVKGRGSNRKDMALGEERSLIGLKAEDFQISHELEVTIEGMTQSQRAANTEYGRELVAEGSISRETYRTDYVGIKDTGQEDARMRQERLAKPLEEAGIMLGLQRGANAVYEAQGNDPIFLPLIQAAGLPTPTVEVARQQAMMQQQQAPPEQPADTQPGSPPTSPKMPGQGMSDKMPVPGQRNGTQPEAMAVGRS